MRLSRCEIFDVTRSSAESPEYSIPTSLSPGSPARPPLPFLAVEPSHTFPPGYVQCNGYYPKISFSPLLSTLDRPLKE